MASDAASALSTLLTSIWSLFDMTYPGLNMSVRSVVFGLFMISIMIYVLRHVFGFGQGSSGPADRSGSRSVSSARRYDEK
mgnify:CR=1 FL=1